MKISRIKYVIFACVDAFFAIQFFSERAAQLLPFLILPFVFILFLAFFQNPQSFIHQWNSWLAQIVKFAFILVGLYIFYKVGHFPVLNDFLVKSSDVPYLLNVGRVEGIVFVFLATFSQICFIIGIIFNLLAFSFPKKFGENVSDYQISFFKALVPTIIFTAVFTFGLAYVGSL
ncbi:MAG: hypothetical protein A3C79_02770 [Candidatus Taylorbacteria bacterium RIFCSPHIGHO2_02_FULL_45_28]|uniref:Uncharacterized protein n=1 Tax=Candidatus Taylorbacteria bacterium RIFCSPHIGHO2_12_FULL_45_16 TaxID=1802315 RepID=A0A1G2N0I6_9BACT|nr:MAG: hypothetical protein A2830_00490 [Candidatus Taylorbacteria bacterium RIFCSPHIGHO2_01_FULL_44_110]OHA24887.1 MAG: hypothetical protein A3C79_02770 [Candidatus Taylorbacteria bacterium RIFCSPHIGHO2_02_FULL_45_28]OHA29705.1 MAG: hypothetical protein A3F51_03185 [Candidatus Taylorbacteria bacterium RIFCSPHIGHO2_12_FULL_45_16]OHA32649.1 MAG: hypothetical protein A3A23_00055 [Candidatus Taylorbacteria bacterium RIFCSPLOWO2_01_FULL_45_59]OHA38802.1 MAG: hypothetical protein A3I98_01490 [Candi